MDRDPVAARLRLTSEATAAIASAIGFAMLGSHLEFDEPTVFDRRARRLAQQSTLDTVRLLLKPLFPLGLPGGYVTIAYATARWMNRRQARGGRAIVSAAWLGWIVHRAVKLGYFRERPWRPDVRRRTDSYPSGHTTGTTSLSVATALVLERNDLVSRETAAAIAIVPSALMGIYRVIADDHWATDVLGGWLLGGAIGFTCDAALGGFDPRAPRVVRSKQARREMESRSKRPRRRGRRERLSSSA
jgi:membrane-associated phospholipid phosphatase